MKTLRAVFYSITLALAGTFAFAAGQVPWNSEDFPSEFKLFQESKAFDRDAWNALPPQAQEQELNLAKAPAGRRLTAMRAWHAAAMEKWDTKRLKGYTSTIKEKDLLAAKLWLGDEAAGELAKKLKLVRATLKKAPREGLTNDDVLALAPYLTPEAVNDLRAMKAAAEAAGAPADKKSSAPKSGSTAALEKFSSSLPAGDPAAIAKFFDGSNARGDAAVNFSGASQPPARQTAAAAAAAKSVPAVQVPVKVKTPAPLPQTKSADTPKSTAWTSDAYGYTVTAGGRTLTYRDQAAAEAAIRALPNGSVSKIILYGHGSPGMQTVGPASYDSDSTAELLKGKMAPGGVIQFSGCNTASIGGATLNPAVGLSMVARRLLYFSLPYFQDRADGIPADQAKEQWEKGWNADLARDTSLNVKGAVVCGYRTFGLVPGRLPGLTRLMGNQEATTPGAVAGKKACYQDGREVPAQ